MKSLFTGTVKQITEGGYKFNGKLLTPLAISALSTYGILPCVGKVPRQPGAKGKEANIYAIPDSVTGQFSV